MEKFGLIGHPIDKSKSPALFNAGYSGKYAYDLIQGDDFEKSYGTFLEEYDGINVTAPFKEQAAKKADGLSPVVKKTGAANLLIKSPEGVKAFNTDYMGIILAVIDGVLPEGGYKYYRLYGTDLSYIRKLLVKIHGKTPKALIAGCGGAGKAAAAAAAAMGYEVSLTNRTVSKAWEIVERMPEYNFKVLDIEDFCRHVRENDLIIYTIPERISQFNDLRYNDLCSKDKIVLEANYKNPSFDCDLQDLMSICKCRYVSGRRWLLYQALVGYGIFTGEIPDFERMEKEL